MHDKGGRFSDSLADRHDFPDLGLWLTLLALHAAAVSHLDVSGVSDGAPWFRTPGGRRRCRGCLRTLRAPSSRVGQGGEGVQTSTGGSRLIDEGPARAGPVTTLVRPSSDGLPRDSDRPGDGTPTLVDHHRRGRKKSLDP